MPADNAQLTLHNDELNSTVVDPSMAAEPTTPGLVQKTEAREDAKGGEDLGDKKAADKTAAAAGQPGTQAPSKDKDKK
jgi:CCR4-NOT transcriptional regulation complex NOT5 subunit